MRVLGAALAGSLVAAATATAATADLGAVVGRALFERSWTSAPASTDSTDGLGPLFNARSCAGCHAGPGLAARFTYGSGGRISGRGLVVRFGDWVGRPDPLYGRLLQVQAVQGLPAEGRVVLTRKPSGGYDLNLDLNRGVLAQTVRTSPRLAPALVGRAALEDVDASAVLALADPDDRDGDGVSGRARLVEEQGLKKLGRYGWKASIGSLKGQIADAFAYDLGLSSSLLPLPFGDCTAREPDCLAAPSGVSDLNDGHEVSGEMIAAVAAFLRDREPDPATPNEAGIGIFAESGCAACHTPKLPLASGGSAAVYSDLLLHDMGPDFDDGVGEPGVSSAEWRTAPLVAVSAGKGRRYLHDGRAGSIDAAVRMHGGEAASARLRYESLSAGERAALLRFLESL